MTTRPFIGITMGDPVGIGPEIIIRALADESLYALCRPLVIGDIDVLKRAAGIVGQNPLFHPVPDPAAGKYVRGTIAVINPCGPFSGPVEWGRPTPETGRFMEAYITTAVDLAVSGKIAAMVTAPINKEALKMGGSPYTGHTELIAERVGCKRYAMMLAGDRLRVVLVTIHMALTRVPAALTPEKIQTVLEITAESLRSRFGIVSPSIAVAGLNPHAGEGGLFGDEEARLIAPAVDKARQTTGATITDPLPPDTVFVAAAAGRYDAVVCMYHDQGLIPLKLLHFEDGVNTTLGLPIIRTSVDHGTAYDIAGTGKAGCASLIAAVRMAVHQATRSAAGTERP
ncbi:MAG: 4-hydroxythreonine-4-phosphate dehydrogenase PdxA [Thermodesulfobacteriota bacterium]